MAQGNVDSATRTTGGSMAEFDKLPKALRMALANADHKVATIPRALAFLRSQDQEKHARDAEAGLIMPGQR